MGAHKRAGTFTVGTYHCHCYLATKSAVTAGALSHTEQVGSITMSYRVFVLY